MNTQNGILYDIELFVFFLVYLSSLPARSLAIFTRDSLDAP